MQETRVAIPSAYNTISSNRSIGYTMTSAIADIVDNSISAGAKNIQLLSPPGKEPLLKICDDGSGMDQCDLDNAMKFGGTVNCQESRDKYDLGRFGMGLKTASLSQCKCLEVISKKAGVLIGGSWDLDYIKTHDIWEYLVIDEKTCIEKIKGTIIESDNCVNGTVVIWSKFDRLKSSSTNRCDEFDLQLNKSKLRLELIFHRYLQGEEGLQQVSISLNGDKLQGNDPFLSNEIAMVSKPQHLATKNGEATLLCHKLPHVSNLTQKQLSRLEVAGTLLETQGFYVYRNKRLIDFGTWFGMVPKLDKTKLSRIQIDINNTQDAIWSLDIKKSHVSPPEVIRGDLKKAIERNGDRSKRTYTARFKRKASPYWNRLLDGKDVLYEINEANPMIADFSSNLTNEQLSSFRAILKNLALFFPFAQLELDHQNDEKIKNEDDNSVNGYIERQVEYLLASGITKDELKSYFPGYEDLIDKKGC